MLSDAILFPSILSLSRSKLPYSVETNACGPKLGAMLFRTQADGERILFGFWSRSFLPAAKSYSIPKKTFLVTVLSLQKLGLYLQGEQFVLLSNPAFLRWPAGKTKPSGRLMRWKLCLCEFTFDIQYKKANLNRQANALSELQPQGRTIVAFDENTLAYSDDATLKQKQVALVPRSVVSDYLLRTHSDKQNHQRYP